MNKNKNFMTKIAVYTALLSFGFSEASPIYAASTVDQNFLSPDSTSIDMSNLQNQDLSSEQPQDLSESLNTDLGIGAVSDISSSKTMESELSSASDDGLKMDISSQTPSTERTDSQSMGNTDSNSIFSQDLEGSDIFSTDLSDMSNMKQAFESEKSDLQGKLSSRQSLDMSGANETFNSIAAAAGIDPSKFDSSSLSLNMDKLDLDGMVKLSSSEANDILKSMMGNDYLGLDSPLFTMNEMPDINYTDLNIQFADLVAGLKEQGFGQTEELIQPALPSGYAADAKTAFEEAFGDLDLQEGAKKFKFTKTADQMLSKTVQTRGKAASQSKYKKSSITKTASHGLSITGKIASAEKANSNPKSMLDTSTAKNNYGTYLSNAQGKQEKEKKKSDGWLKTQTGGGKTSFKGEQSRSEGMYKG